MACMFTPSLSISPTRRIRRAVFLSPMVGIHFQSISDCLLMLFSIAVSWMDPNLPEGVYPWRSQDHTVTKRGDSITLTDTDTLAGAAVPLDKSVRNLAKFCGIPLSKAIHCASRNPAKCLGGSVVKSKGALKVGFDADLTVWDKKTGELLSTWRAGRQVFGKLELQNPT